MFLKKLFAKKNFLDCEQKGDKLFALGRYADARIELTEALELLAATSPDNAQMERERIQGKLLATGQQLAWLNIREAKFAFSSGAVEKAAEYLELAAHFSQEPEISREIAELISGDKLKEIPATKTNGAHGCATCTPHDVQPSVNTESSLYLLSNSEQFELLVAPLPDDLPKRYRDLGEEFAAAILSGHAGDHAAAYTTYAQLHQVSPSDIYLYEMAVIKAQAGAIRETEKLLKDALELNSVNSLCCLSLVQLYSDQRRYGEARSLLERMQSNGIMGKQVLLMLGDTAMAVGDAAGAEELYRQALAEKELASTAAERLLPILEQTGRHQEREFLAKKHCGKGCC